MVNGQSHMVITGPAIIREVTGEDISLEELGGAKVHSEITGQAHLVAESDRECIEIIKKLLSYLPSNNEEHPPVISL
jgi:propionyl-CoA carboxylase beta chain